MIRNWLVAAFLTGFVLPLFPRTVVAAGSDAVSISQDSRTRVDHFDARLVEVQDTAPVAAPAPALPTEPQILRSTLVLRADRMVRYWKHPDTDDYWSWIPTGEFYVLGPVDTGTQFAVDYTLPDGKPWMTVEAPCPKLAPNGVARVDLPRANGHMDKRAILETGIFGYKIRLINELTNANTVMMSGKFKVAKIFKGNGLPAFKNQFEYYVDQDWTLPIGYLWLDWLNEPKVPQLHVGMWFKGDNLDDTKLAAYLFYNGKQIGGSSAHSTTTLVTNGSADGDPRWQRWEFTMYKVRGWNVDDSGNNWDDTLILSKSPGNYQIKVLRDGNLVRTAGFTVGADGKIVDNGVVAANHIGGIAMIVPVKILGDSDGKWDSKSWQTQAFYGNPLQGFKPAS